MLRLPKYKYLFAIADFFIMFSSSVFAFYFTAINKRSNILIFVWYNSQYFYSSLLIALVFIFIFQANNLYKINIILAKSLYLTSIIRSLFYGSVSAIVIAFLIKFQLILNSRKFLLIFLLITIILLIIVRFLILPRIYLNFVKSKFLKRKVIIIDAGKSGKILFAKLVVEKNLGLSVVGFVDDGLDKGITIVGDKKNLGKVSDLSKIIKEFEIDEVILAIDNITYERLLEIMDVCNATGSLVKITSELFEVIPSKLNIEKYSNIPVVNVSPEVNISITIVFKRIIDFIGSIFGLIILSPFFAVISLLIKFSSKGPIFYKQKRIGKDGRVFNFLKFRSMKIVDGEDHVRKKNMIEFMKNGTQQNGNNTKIINESRVTRIGKFIRRTSLDELPQLINVIKGEMSLVGPRPCLPYEYENYDEWQKRRVKVLPGCTGVWQVFGRCNVSFKDSIVLDLYYINNMSPWLDLQLIFKTIPVMLFSKGGE